MFIFAVIKKQICNKKHTVIHPIWADNRDKKKKSKGYKRVRVYF
jgi:hypothetical protein